MQPRSDFFTLADNGRMRFSILPPENPWRATMIVMPGRREFIEKKVFETAAYCKKKGYGLLTFEWRGQGLSDRFLKGPQRQRDHVENFNLYLDDWRAFYRGVVLPNAVGPQIALAHSMGAHLLSRWLQEDQPTTLSAAVLTSPMFAIGPRSFENLTFLMARFKVKRQQGQDYAFFQHDYNDYDRAFALNPLSHDKNRFAIIEEYFDKNPELVVGGVTWHWLMAALLSMKKARLAPALERIQQKILLLTGDEDSVTPAKRVRAYARAIPHLEETLFKGARHDLLNEIDPITQQVWARIDGFLDKNVPTRR